MHSAGRESWLRTTFHRIFCHWSSKAGPEPTRYLRPGPAWTHAGFHTCKDPKIRKHTNVSCLSHIILAFMQINDVPNIYGHISKEQAPPACSPGWQRPSHKLVFFCAPERQSDWRLRQSFATKTDTVWRILMPRRWWWHHVDTWLWQFPSTESRGLQAKSFYYTSVWFAPELFHGHGRVFVHHVNSDLSLPLCVLECCTTKFAQQPRTGQNQQTRNSTLALH